MRIYTASATAENVVALFGNFEPTDGAVLCDTSLLIVNDLAEGGGCGPVLIENADSSTNTNCDRSYALGSGFDDFFALFGGDKYLIQDAHDPNDHAWDNNDFASITVPPGMMADLYLLVPVGSSGGHSHSANEYPNVIDPRGGWVDVGVEYTESNGIPRHVWTKSVQGTHALYHTVTLGWGWTYMFSLRCTGSTKPTVSCDQVSQPNVSPTECYDGVSTDVPLWMDRSYAWTTGPSDVLAGGWVYFRVSLEPGSGAPCSDPANPTANGREGGFDGNIAVPATIAICCANHCGRANTPIDKDVLTDSPSSTMTWWVHPGTFAISNHGGEPCTFFETTVAAGDYTFCCSSCWGSGLFLTTAATQVAGVMPNLEGYYSFDDDSAQDSSGNDRNGEWSGTEAYEDGVFGRAAKFDGSSRIIVSAFENFEWGNALTVAFWFNRGPGCDGNYQGIVSTGYHASGSWEVRMGREGGCTALGGGVVTQTHDATWDHLGSSQGGGVPPAAVDEWHFVVLTYDGVGVKFYVDNAAQPATADDTGPIVTVAVGLYIGHAGPPKTNE